MQGTLPCGENFRWSLLRDASVPDRCSVTAPIIPPAVTLTRFPALPAGCRSQLQFGSGEVPGILGVLACVDFINSPFCRELSPSFLWGFPSFACTCWKNYICLSPRQFPDFIHAWPSPLLVKGV